MDDLDSFLAALDAAMIDQGPVGAVHMETAEGLEVLLYGPESAGYAGGGTLFIPAAVLDSWSRGR